MLKQLELSITNAWQQDTPALIWLRPISWIYQIGSAIRRAWYKLIAPKALPVPVIVVGNITVGGSGKTPVVITLAKTFTKLGIQVGIVSRGHKSSLNKQPTQVNAHHTPDQVGDEPLLTFFSTQVPVVIGKDRLKAAKWLLKHNPHVKLILADDGLQHYRLPRAKEIAVVEPTSWGNMKLLPEGPLRESLNRLKSVDYILSSDSRIGGFHVEYVQSEAIEHRTGQVDEGLEGFRGRTVHAVAAIANPKRFFDMLRSKGIHVNEHVFADHHLFTRQDLEFETAYPILMTEKDAIKCHTFKDLQIWVVKLEAQIDKKFIHKLIEDLSDG